MTSSGRRNSKSAAARSSMARGAQLGQSRHLGGAQTPRSRTRHRAILATNRAPRRTTAQRDFGSLRRSEPGPHQLLEGQRCPSRRRHPQPVSRWTGLEAVVAERSRGAATQCLEGVGRARRRFVTPQDVDEAITRHHLVGVDQQRRRVRGVAVRSQPDRFTLAHDLQWPEHAQRRATRSSTDPPSPTTPRQLELRSRCDHPAPRCEASP